MNRLETPETPETPPAANPPPLHGRGRWGAMLVVGLALAFTVPLGLKIASAMAARKSLETSRKGAAEAAMVQAQKPSAVSVVRPAPRAWIPVVPLEGTLHPIQQVDLSFRSPGTISTVRVKVGDRVEKGAILASLDSSDLQASQAVYAAQVKAAEVQLWLAQDNNAIASALVTSGAAASTSATQSKGGVELASANLSAARAQVGAMGVAIRNATLTAPFSGIVTLAPTASGGSASPGVPLFRLVDISSLRLLGTISEQDAPLAVVGAPVSLMGVALEGGKVSSVLPTLDPATRRASVEALIPNRGSPPLLAGAFVRATIAGSTKLDVLTLASAALRSGTQDEVFVVNDGKATLRRISFARGESGDLLVRSGLTAADLVVLAPSPDLVNGAPVEPSVAAQ